MSCNEPILLSTDPDDIAILEGPGVQSVNGKVGKVVLDAGDFAYDDTKEYSAGSVGAELKELSQKEIDVDSALSDTSTNPVQNKVVKAEVDDLKDNLNQLPTDETGQEWLEEEELRTLYEGAFLDTLDRIFTNLPQDETMGEIVHELETENSWFDQLYREVAASMA